MNNIEISIIRYLLNSTSLHRLTLVKLAEKEGTSEEFKDLLRRLLEAEDVKNEAAKIRQERW